MTPSPAVGIPHDLEPDLRLIIAPNPGPLTFWGTNTYILGQGPYVVIDPGPVSEPHLGAILDATRGDISHILVSHTHADHSPLARPLAERTKAKTYAFGASRDGMSAVMRTLEASGHGQSSEGLDHDFRPDDRLSDGEALETPVGRITALHTPGHLGNHLCFVWRDVIFSADHVMGWATSVVSPPFGDLTDFMASCEKLLDHPARRYFAGHGAPIDQPLDRVRDLIDHRRLRESQILAALESGPTTIETLTPRLYADTPSNLHPAAARNIFAHLIDLTQRNMCKASNPLNFKSVFERL